MQSNEFLLKDTQGLEQEIEHHCAGLGLDCTNEFEVHRFVQALLQDMVSIKDSANKGDRTARAKIELFSMLILMHEANIKAYGTEYMEHLNALLKREPSWVVLARAMWSELEKRRLGK